MTIKHDLHIHTHLSACCGDKEGMRAGNIIASATARGLDTVGFSDHLWANPAITPSEWYQPQDEQQVVRLRHELLELPEEPLIRVLVGCEADMRAPGEFGITPELAASLDFVLLACSHFHMRSFVEQPPERTPEALARHLLRFFRSGVNSGLATSIAHPFMPLGDFDKLDAIHTALDEHELSDALSEAAANGVALEITLVFLPRAGADGKPLFSLETPQRLISLAKAAGCKFTFGSDGSS